MITLPMAKIMVAVGDYLSMTTDSMESMDYDAMATTEPMAMVVVDCLESIV